MRLRSLSVALLAGIVLVPVSASGASAHGSASKPHVSAMAKTFKNGDAKRLKRAKWVAARDAAAAAAAIVAPRTTATTPTGSVTTAPVVSAPTTTVSYADRVLALTNAERTSRGLRALAFSSCAGGFADRWATSLAAAGSLSHQSLSPILSTCAARSVGENVAFGNVSAETLVQMWMNSPGHRANILNAGFTHLGVGDATTSTGRVYGVQVFLTL